MGVGRDAGNTFDPEVERGEWESGLGHEDNEETSQTGVHVHRDVVAHSQLQHTGRKRQDVSTSAVSRRGLFPGG